MLIDFNIKEKIKELKSNGKNLPAEYFDLGVAFWLLNPDEKEYTPEYLSKKYLHNERNPSTRASSELQPNSSGLSKLHQFAQKKLKEYKLQHLFKDLEMPLIDILSDMELRGIRLDIEALKKLDQRLQRAIEELVRGIYKKAGKTFNINSHKQISALLFEKLKVDSGGIRKTKSGGFSTDIEMLSLLKDRHPIVAQLIEYRELFKMQSTYVRPLQELVGNDGRIHTNYIQTGTATGRLSSQHPNLQNIPNGTAWATALRSCFVADRGYTLVSFDYSQIELRILASLSGDPKMIEAFERGLDIHTATAANIFNVDPKKVTSEMRRVAKTLNFGVVYGMGAIAFSKTSGLSFAEAKKFIAEYFSDFSKIKEWQERIKEQVRTAGYVTNLNGRRRWLLKAVSMFRGESAEAERAAINMPVQGLAADIIKVAMVQVAAELKRKGWWNNQVRMLLTIHDELLFEIKDDIMKEAIPLIARSMESAYQLAVPITVTIKRGKNWGRVS